MRKEFVSDPEDEEAVISVEDAQGVCPWASFFRRAYGGIWCFESHHDAKLWDNTKTE